MSHDLLLLCVTLLVYNSLVGELDITEELSLSIRQHRNVPLKNFLVRRQVGSRRGLGPRWSSVFAPKSQQRQQQKRVTVNSKLMTPAWDLAGPQYLLRKVSSGSSRRGLGPRWSSVFAPKSQQRQQQKRVTVNSKLMTPAWDLAGPQYLLRKVSSGSSRRGLGPRWSSVFAPKSQQRQQQKRVTVNSKLMTPAWDLAGPQYLLRKVSSGSSRRGLAPRWSSVFAPKGQQRQQQKRVTLGTSLVLSICSERSAAAAAEEVFAPKGQQRQQQKRVTLGTSLVHSICVATNDLRLLATTALNITDLAPAPRATNNAYNKQ
ncbi:hypothetical protein J6590_033540 [Homalodisca vitripennis]|nr:hypothetical protein J6590_033540 [Homalodisca vitripennis]